MKTIFLKDAPQYVGQEIELSGWVDVRRDHGKLIFFDLRDGSGKIQVVALPKHSDVRVVAETLRPEWTVKIRGMVNKRPESMVNAKQLNGTIEFEALEITVLSQAKELPFEKDSELNLDTYLDHLPLTLRSDRGRDIFHVQATILDAYRSSLRAQGFTEFMSPVLVGGDAEGGAAAFSVNYYYDQKAYLATSPQFYKQIMVGVYERSCTIAKIFRGEKHATSRHLSEVTQMDFEMGFIKDHHEPMVVLEQTIKNSVTAVCEKHADVLERFAVEKPLMPEHFPILTLREAQEIIKTEYKIDCQNEPDLDPEHERLICEWAKEKHNSDFVFITHFPTAKRAFYTYEDPDEAPFSRGFDLLFRGLEINSGAQRIHDYDMLVQRIKDRGMNPDLFSFYLQAFKYGMPPHGGSSTGLERFTARMLGLFNVKEATLFPRDMNRIDLLLNQ